MLVQCSCVAAAIPATAKKPAEVLVLDGKPNLIRKRDEFQDLLRGQVEVL